jgi:CubicO group peptidase (beta-lactamase class C family)
MRIQNNIRILFIILLTFQGYFICSGHTKNDKLLACKLDSALREVFKDTEPGGSIFIQKGNKILYKRSFGLANIQTGRRFNARTLANTGSISKTFVAYGILMLQNQGKLSVEDSISTYFPEFKNKSLADKIKIRHLLTHTSGLPDSRNVAKDSIFYLTAKDYENFRPLTLSDTLEFEPGSRWNYSNPAYNGLALIIEKVTGLKWQDFIIKNILKPSGMRTSKITDGAYPEKHVAHGYSWRSNHYAENDYGEYPTFAASGNGGVWSSIHDLRKYVQAIAKCRFTDCATMELSETILTPSNWASDDSIFHSLVWFVHPSISYDYHAEEKCRVIEHTGSQGGFMAHLIMIPEYDMTIIWLTNNETFLTDKIRKILFSLKYIQ